MYCTYVYYYQTRGMRPEARVPYPPSALSLLCPSCRRGSNSVYRLMHTAYRLLQLPHVQKSSQSPKSPYTFAPRSRLLHQKWGPPAFVAKPPDFRRGTPQRAFPTVLTPAHCLPHTAYHPYNFQILTFSPKQSQCTAATH